MKELNTILLTTAREEDALKLSSEKNELIVTVRRTRDVDADRVQMVLGPALWGKYGKANITMAVIDSLLRGSELTDEQKGQLKSLISFNMGEPWAEGKAAHRIPRALGLHSPQEPVVPPSIRAAGFLFSGLGVSG
jgi:hypothetical protein